MAVNYRRAGQATRALTTPTPRQRPFDPSSLMLDSGESFAGELDPASLRNIGIQQNDQRRAQIAADDASMEGRKRGLGLGGSSWDAWFGLMQARENAAGASGRRFDFDVDGFGTNKAIDVPTGRSYNMDAGEVAPGLRGRNPEIAQEQGLDPKQSGYYTPDELRSLSRNGLSNALNGIRRRAR